MKNFNDTLEFGKQLINKNIDEALILFENLNKENPNNEEVLFELGKVYYIKQNFIRAKIALEQIKNKNNYHLNLLLAKIYKSLNQNFSSLKIFLTLYKQSKNIEIEEEIVNLFLINKQDYLAIKFLLKYNKKNNNLNNILKIYINNITKKVANNKFEAIKKEIIKAIKLLNNHTFNNEYLKEKNILLNEYEIGEKKVILKSKPRNLTVTLTNKCILKCRMCKNVKLKYDFILNESYFNEIKRLIPYLQRVVWLGGEVFLYDKFFELFDISNLYRVKQNIATNALLLNKNNIKKLLESYDLELNLSIDALTKSTYENIRMGARFENLMDNIDLLNSLIRDKNNVCLYVNVVVSRWNMEENFLNYIDFCIKYNIKQIFFSLDMYETNNMKIIDNFNLKYRKILEQEFNNLNITVVFLIPISNVSSTESKINLKQHCLQPWKSMMVDCNTIRFADLCPEIGKMEEDSLEKIWNCQKAIDLRNQILIYQNTKCGNICKNNFLDFQRFKM